MKIILLIFLTVSSILANNSIEQYTKLSIFTLEVTSIKDVLKTLGKTKIIKSGNAGNSSTRINYFIKNNNYFITFNSGEMGGGKFITSFVISQKAPREKYRTLSNINLSLWKSLKLGMEKKDFLKIVQNLEKINNTYFYEKSTKVKYNNPNMQIEDLLISITPKFINKKLVKIEIYRVTTF